MNENNDNTNNEENETAHNHSDFFKKNSIKDALSGKEDFEHMADIFALLADATRLKLFWLLCHSKECVVNLADMLEMTTPAVSHHLKLLKVSGLIESYRDGKEVFYAAASDSKSKLLHKNIEELMTISCPDFEDKHEKINTNSTFMENQIEVIRKIHDYLIENLSSRITIEELAKIFAMNPTTLKTVFKDVYGNSLAAHIKEHRMEAAAKYLVESEMSVNEIALKVGYESQSKFSAGFKEFYNLSPAEYRKSRC